MNIRSLVTIQTIDGKEDVVRSQQQRQQQVQDGGRSAGCHRQHRGTVRRIQLGVQQLSDGRFDATENWRRIQSARIRNETAEEAEDPRTEPISVARDMIAAQEDGGKATLKQRRFWKRDSCCGTGLNRIGGGRSL